VARTARSGWCRVVPALAAGRLAEERRVAADSARRVAVAERVLAQAARAAAVRSAAVAREEADKAAAVSAFLGEMLASGDPERARGRTVSVAHAWLRGLAAPAGTAERARIAARLAAFYAQRGRPAESAAWRERSAAP
jgi:hypothetical protein